MYKGFPSLQDQWLEQYEAEDFPTDVYKVWTEETEIAGRKLSLEKFYKHLHAYVRRKLNNFYGQQVINHFAYITPSFKSKLYFYTS